MKMFIKLLRLIYLQEIAEIFISGNFSDIK